MITCDSVRSILFTRLYESWRDEGSIYDSAEPDKDLLTPIVYDNYIDDRQVTQITGDGLSSGSANLRQSFPEVRDDWAPKDGWLAFSLEFGHSEQDSLGPQGNRRFVRQGFIQASMYSKVGTGVYSHDKMADTVKEGFESKRLYNNDRSISVVTGAMRYTHAGSEDGLFISVCVLPFEFDEIK